MIRQVGRTLPFSSEQVFDIAADIERYPEFLRWWTSAHIQRREGNVCYVDQVVSFGPFPLKFSTRAVLERPQRIEVSSSDAPFRKYSLCWSLDALSAAECRISIEADMELQSRMIQHVVDRLLPGNISEIIASFEARACALYGG